MVAGFMGMLEEHLELGLHRMAKTLQVKGGEVELWFLKHGAQSLGSWGIINACHPQEQLRDRGM